MFGQMLMLGVRSCQGLNVNFQDLSAFCNRLIAGMKDRRYSANKSFWVVNSSDTLMVSGTLTKMQSSDMFSNFHFTSD